VALTHVTWALASYHKNEIVDVYHMYNKEFFKIIYIEKFGWINNIK
jgi:hypothetical protein